MEALDVVENINPSFRTGLITTSIHTFSFQLTEEALNSGIISTAANSAHAADQIVSF
jgi:hypothetical protein